ncbi:helix-turn-helix transcriptional regulator [Krasilnikovia sp. M28-CT-15]|uniref:helix-turn-helix transcriptional regulator n=1 Tax=Krasilnikovia sp. M28-CT-15 TaxID=3373540 RepID=UPI00387651B1
MDPTTVTREPQRYRFEFATTDPDQAGAYLSTAHATTTIKGARHTYRFRHVRLDAGTFSFDTLDHQASTDYDCGPFPVVSVARVHRGLRTDRDLGECLGPGGLVLHAPPSRRYHLRQESVFWSLISMTPQAVAEAARNRPDDPAPRLRFTSTRPANLAAARGWLHVVGYITDSLNSAPGFIAHPLLAGPMTRLLAASLLATFPNTCLAEPHHHDRTDATGTTLSRAVAFIESNADLDITAVDIARAARVSVRAVQRAFRRHLDTTPTAYLRRVRLDRAHQQLLAAQPGDGTTITTVAAQWGFPNPARFTNDYHGTYRQPTPPHLPTGNH